MIYVTEPTSKMLIFPYCSLLSITNRSVRLCQHCVETEKETPIPINHILFSIYNAPTNWVVIEELNSFNPLALNYNIAINLNSLGNMQHRVSIKEVDWLYVEEFIQKKDFIDTFSELFEESNNKPAPDFNLHNCYTLLGVEEGAPVDTIKTVFHKLSMIYHPDRPTGNNNHYRTLSSAYETIMNNKG